MRGGRTILNYKSNHHHYKADACIVWCFDDRFSGLLNKFVKIKKFRRYDLIKIAGGATTLGDNASKEDKEFIIKQIKASIRLHAPLLVILMTHSDCGACGGLEAFDNNPKLEFAKHRKFLKQAKSVLRRHLPRSIRVEAVFADFEKLVKV
jgi:carbonic anhydrase